MAVDVERARRRFTIEEYERMVETGILARDDRVELIDGEVVEMSPIGTPHAAFVANLNHLLVHAVGNRALVWIQGPVRVPPRSVPQPDLALLRPRSYVRQAATRIPRRSRSTDRRRVRGTPTGGGRHAMTASPRSRSPRPRFRSLRSSSDRVSSGGPSTPSSAMRFTPIPSASSDAARR